MQALRELFGLDPEAPMGSSGSASTVTTRSPGEAADVTPIDSRRRVPTPSRAPAFPRGGAASDRRRS